MRRSSNGYVKVKFRNFQKNSIQGHSISTSNSSVSTPAFQLQRFNWKRSLASFKGTLESFESFQFEARSLLQKLKKQFESTLSILCVQYSIGMHIGQRVAPQPGKSWLDFVNLLTTLVIATAFGGAENEALSEVLKISIERAWRHWRAPRFVKILI